MKNALDDLIVLSKYAGERFDLVQAAGGNSSIKNAEGSMWIKASGVSLSEIDLERGYCHVNYRKLLEDWSALRLRGQKLGQAQRDSEASVCTLAANLTGGSRPSIETLLHSLLGPVTLHTHPIAVNSLVCQARWKEKLAKICPEAICVEYRTPGFSLALALQEALEKAQWHYDAPAVVFLENHGLIVSAASIGAVMETTDAVVTTIEQALTLNLSDYKLANQLTALMSAASPSARCVSYKSEDRVLQDAVLIKKDLLLSRPICPDQVVYCGPVPLLIRSLDDTTAIKYYIAEHKQLPKVIVYLDTLFLVGDSIKKCREQEEVLKFHVLALSGAGSSEVRFLPDEEVHYLMGWEAEKYRQSL